MSEIHKALAKAQSEFPEISKDGKVSYGKTNYKYTTLPNLIKSVRPVLNKNGLSISWSTQDEHMICTLFHASGESITSSLKMCSFASKTEKDIGALSTYFRRYTYENLLGIAGQEDTDGLRDSNLTPPQNRQRNAPNQPNKPAQPQDKSYRLRDDFTFKTGEFAGQEIGKVQPELLRMWAVTEKSKPNVSEKFVPFLDSVLKYVQGK
jgi:hypothetical protein